MSSFIETTSCPFAEAGNLVVTDQEDSLEELQVVHREVLVVAGLVKKEAPDSA